MGCRSSSLTIDSRHTKKSKFTRFFHEKLIMLRRAFISFAICLSIGFCAGINSRADAADEKGAATKLPLLLDENFSKGADRWAPAAPEGWKIIDIDGGKAYSEFKSVDLTKRTPHRSPWNIALLKDVVVGDFVLEVKLRETAKEVPHRDCVLIFGYQSPSKMYYIHFAPVTGDKHADQVFIVNDADRLMITDQDHLSPGVHWGEPTEWHKLKIVRDVADGKIEAYFDDMDKPLMTAHDKNFTWGRIGIGTFDDTADFAEVKLWGGRVKAPIDHVDGPAYSLEPIR
jgi:hypothetical protein